MSLLAILDAESIELPPSSANPWAVDGLECQPASAGFLLVLSNTPGGLNIPSVQEALTRSRQEFAERGVGSAAVAPDFPSRNPNAAYLLGRSVVEYRLEDLSGRSPAACNLPKWRDTRHRL